MQRKKVKNIANEQNLIAGGHKLTAEELSRGGINSGNSRREKRDVKRLCAELLGREVTKEEAKKLKAALGLQISEGQTMASVMVTGQIQSAIGGNTKAFETLTEYAEKSEKDEEKGKAKWTVPITDITSDFVELYRTIHAVFDGEEDIHEIVLKGGRGSVKSNAIGDIAYETILQDKQAHVVYTRRFKVDLRGSVYNQFMKTVIRYNDLDNWEFKQSPLCAVYKPTGQMVMFVGADKPISLKSFNVPFGYVKLLIHEECDEMAGIEQMDNIEDTFLRSDTPALDIKIFNPPKSKNNFMNEYVEECENKPHTKVFHSYYYNVPVKWLGQRFFDRAEWFRIHKPLYYKNNYLGEVTGTGGGCFDNVEIRTISDEEISTFDKINHGLDWGYRHPQVFAQNYYDDETDTLYIFGEVYSKQCKNATFARKLKKFMDVEIICDSARPDAIAEFQDWGFNAIGAKKRWGTNKGREYCLEWLQQTTKIVIDRDRCPHTAHEFLTLEYEQLADGTFADRFPTIGEDCVCANMYALNRVIMESRRNDGLYSDFNEYDDMEDEDEYDE